MNRISDYVFLTTKEVEVMLEKAADQEVHDRFHKSGAREVVLKDAERACNISTADQFIELAAEKVETVVDITAAGDDFIVY